MPCEHCSSDETKYAEKLKILRRLVKDGIDDLETGCYREIAESDLDQYFEELMERAAARVRQ